MQPTLTKIRGVKPPEASKTSPCLQCAHHKCEEELNKVLQTRIGGYFKLNYYRCQEPLLYFIEQVRLHSRTVLLVSRVLRAYAGICSTPHLQTCPKRSLEASDVLDFVFYHHTTQKHGAPETVKTHCHRVKLKLNRPSATKYTHGKY